MTSNVKKLLIDLLMSSADDEMLRDDLLRRMESFNVPKMDTIRMLKLADPATLVKRNPIIYNREKLIASLNGTFKPLQGRGAAVTAEPVAVASDDEPPAKMQRAPVEQAAVTAEVQFMESIIDATLDPSLDRFFPTKSYKQLRRRMNPNFPMNIYVYGDTGVGKSTAVLHVAKEQGRSCIRVNLSRFADVDELFGGMRIVNGTTFFDKGPVLVAMEMGAVLLLDECDSADPTLLTDLHPVLEKRGYLIKKLKRMVYAKPGFCVVATGNTKGRGDLTGKYIGTSPLNRAFLDRFATSIHYESPTRGELKRIIEGAIPMSPSQVVEGVCAWYEQIANAVERNAVEEHISPRKILDIVELMLSDGVQDVRQAEAKECVIEGTNLFDDHVSKAMGELWDSVVNG